MEASHVMGSSPPDDTSPQSAVSLLDLELLDALPPEPPSLPPPAWVIDDEDELSLDGADPAVPTPWRPQRGAFATAFMVHVCFFLIGLAGARSAYARLGTASATVASVTHRKSPTLDRVFVIRDVGRSRAKGRAALRTK